MCFIQTECYENATVQGGGCGGAEKAYSCRVERKERQKEFGQCGKDRGEKKNRQCVLSDKQGSLFHCMGKMFVDVQREADDQSGD